MKKLLALVLALVMTMGLATVATNAAYPDAADIDLTEAVDVMTAVGVFKGDEKGNFAPKANLDRAAAAKLIAYLDLGEKAAEALPAVKAFNDVPASHWASKYIAYCASAGFINGAGDGNFYPGNSLTGYAFGKMILCVLGYDAAIEGFTGSAWSINVAKLMQSNDIAEGVDGNASATLTREQAAQYCLNALKADVVEYSQKGTTITVDGTTINTGASKASKVEEKKNKYDGDNDGVQQLAEKLFDEDLKLTSDTSNAFNATATKWKYKNSDVGTYADSPEATYTGKVTRGTIYTLLGKDVYDDIKDGNATLTTYVDGVKFDGTGSTTDYSGINEVVKNSSGKAFGTGAGMVTEVYIDDDGVVDGAGNKYAKVTVVVKNTYLMQATDDYNSKTEKLSVDVINGSAKTTLTSDDVADDVAIDGYKEDDYILYTYADGKVQSMEKATIVSGKVNSYSKADSVTIDGTKYSYSTTVPTDATHGKNVTFKTGEVATVVLDAQGKIIYVDELVASNDNVLFVTGLDTFSKYYTAYVVFPNGKQETITVNKDKSDAVATDKVFAYKVLDNGQYKLTDYDTAKWDTESAGTYTFNKNTGVFTGVKATSDTVNLVEDDDGDITLYTGVKNAPKTVKTSDTVLYVNNSDNELLYVYIVATKNGVTENSTANDELIYILKKDKTFTDEDDDSYTEYVALVNGEKTTLKVDTDLTVNVGDFYTKQNVNSKGYVTSLTAADSSSDDYEAIAISSATKDAFTFSSDVFEAVGVDSWYVKTDKVFVNVTGGKLLDDPAASYELTETTFKGLQNFVKGYEITADGWLVFNADDEVVGAYFTILTSAEA